MTDWRVWIGPAKMDTLEETLALDAESPAFDNDLRVEIEAALAATDTFHLSEAQHAALKALLDAGQADPALVASLVAAFASPAQAAYLAASHCCPRCGGDQLDAGRIDIEDGQAVQSVSCNACETGWHDVYVLTGAAGLTAG